MTDVECIPGCGKCCNPVVLPVTQLEIAQTFPISGDELADRLFILNDLTPLSTKEGLRLAPYLKGRVLSSTANGGAVMAPKFYSCRHYDSATRLCTNYENRPPVCREHPRYGLDRVQPNTALPFECSFNEDVPVELRNRPPAGWRPDLLEGATFM